MNKGVLIGVGVGVGDPEDLTLKAVKCIKESDVICLPRKDKLKCRAYLIVKEAVPEIEEKELLGFEFEMIKDSGALQRMHREIYEEIRKCIEEGKKVALLTIGDPTVYSTFMYIAEQARKDDIPVRIISGITSFCASAARLGISLCEGDAPLYVISDARQFERKSNLNGTTVVMKCGRVMAELKDHLRKVERELKVHGGFLEVYAVSDAGLPQEQRYFGLEELPEEAPYMTTMIIKEIKRFT